MSSHERGSAAQQIRQFILTNFLFTTDESALTDDDSLLGRGILDSTGVLELVAFLEVQYTINVADDELVPEHLDSVSRIVDFVARKQQMGRDASVTA
jgi:acyl carrier protein